MVAPLPAVISGRESFDCSDSSPYLYYLSFPPRVAEHLLPGCAVFHPRKIPRRGFVHERPVIKPRRSCVLDNPKHLGGAFGLCYCYSHWLDLSW